MYMLFFVKWLMNKRYQNSVLRTFSCEILFWILFRLVHVLWYDIFLLDFWHSPVWNPGQSWWIGHKSNKSHPISDYHTIALKLLTVECCYSNCHSPVFARQFSSHALHEINGGHKFWNFTTQLTLVFASSPVILHALNTKVPRCGRVIPRT